MTIKNRRRERYEVRDDVVPVTGLEPVRCRQRWILSPLRLPIPSHRRVNAVIIQQNFRNFKQKNTTQNAHFVVEYN